MAVSVFFVMGALGLLIGPGIAGGVSDLGTATFTFGGILGGAKLILVARVTCVLVVADVFGTLPLVNFEVPFVNFVVPFVNFVVLLVVVLLSGFFACTEVGRLLISFGELLVRGCLLDNVDVRGVLGFGVVADFVKNGVFEVVGVLVVDTGVVLVIDVRCVVSVVLVEAGRVAGIVVLDVGFGTAFVIGVAFKVVVFIAVVGRTLVIGLEVDGAVTGLDNGFDVVDNAVFLVIGVVILETNDFVGKVFVVNCLALEVVVSNFFGADFLEVKLAPAIAAVATVPTTAAVAISAIYNLINY